ncbi:MAG: flagellar biosynthetic protein FliQ [Clostridiaceae bacterium]|mgnify:CR=1 FL=1|jgi:flagellar biosynthetic protein FliQ|nr:flagellar biosynthetic protein FliQ [Clostridiaceae bacterium]MCI9485321.1 flagellar biosynthetic protein FliQ [Clostridiaceae bacterium]NBH81085.1 flagellar biosynthetic protein FliQ [Clostridiaceae bacterium]NBI84516.1 flagellar biosynthetic protein FliQ [Clostridiaceae bacterium]RKJ79925.1 flagellar biosynthetic protein FliQ [Butyricicoccus sp. 1XD8-22]
MGINQVTDVFRDGIGVAIRLGAPILLLALAVGVVTAILQAVTQIHEQTIAFVLKLLVIILFLVVGGSWMMMTLQEYALGLFELMK